MKKFLALMMAMMMAFGVAACGGEEAPAEEPTDDAVEEVVDNEVSDGGADGFTLLDCELLEVPDLTGAAWNFCGGYMDDAELTEEEYTESMEMYCGKLQFIMNEDGTAEMAQGGGSIYGTYEALDDYMVSAVFDNNGTELAYTLIFIDLDGTTMVAMTDTTGETGLYFAQ